MSALFGSFIPRGRELLVNGVQVEVRNDLHVPFIIQPTELLVNGVRTEGWNGLHVPFIFRPTEGHPLILCFVGDCWWPMSREILSECLGIPEPELMEIIGAFQRNPESAEERLDLISRFQQRNPPSTEEVQNL